MNKKVTDSVEFFNSHYQVAPNGCWIWTGNIAPSGYGRLVVNGRYEYAHRFSYRHFKGEIPEGLHLDHLCRNRACVNPENIEPVTLVENIKRGFKARLGGRTHCEKGHLLPFPRDNEKCRQCSVEHSKAYSAKRTQLNARKYATSGPICPECKGPKKRKIGHSGRHTAPIELIRNKNQNHKICLFCGKEYPAYPSEKRKYCSTECAYASPERVSKNPQNKPGWHRKLMEIAS
jgi:hypothetical protein